MEDYEFYSVDPYDPLDPDREWETYLRAGQITTREYMEAEAQLDKLFKPVAEVQHPGCLFPLKMAVIGGVPLLKTETVADIEATLLRRHK